MTYKAIYWNNLPLLKFMYTYPFNINALIDKYTNIENAIISDRPGILDFLLILKPDVITLHSTKINGETKVLLLAERVKQPGMLEKLKQYVTKN